MSRDRTTGPNTELGFRRVARWGKSRTFGLDGRGLHGFVATLSLTSAAQIVVAHGSHVHDARLSPVTARGKQLPPAGFP